MQKKKFLTLVENAIVRNTNGGLLVGDNIRFVNGYKTKEDYKSLPDNVKKHIDILAKSDLNLFITNIKTSYPSSYTASELNRSDCFKIEIAQELAPGLLDRQNKVTVCCSLIEPINNYPNLPKIPDSVKRVEKINMKPVPVTAEENEETVNSPHNQTSKAQQGEKLKETERYLPTKNTVIPNVTGKDPKIEPIKESYINRYMKGF
jgi:hypothetical protein